MVDISKTSNVNGLIDAIGILSSNHASGRLQVRVGAMRGAFFFNNGKLADARMGSLSGFAAVNAAVSMRDAQWSFDPSVPPPASSFTVLNERVVLKQLFGIEAMEPGVREDESNDYSTLSDEPDPEATLIGTTIPTSPIANYTNYASDESPIVSDELDREATSINQKTPTSSVPEAIPYQEPASFSSAYRSGLYIALLLILMSAVAVVLLLKFGDSGSTAQVASSDTSEANSPTSVAPTSVANSPTSVTSSPTAAPNLPTSLANSNKSYLTPPAPETRQGEQQTSVTQDLSGKWNVVNTVQKTSYRSFNNLQIGFRLEINQRGKEFTAKGEKISENGRILPASGRTPIHVNGSIKGDRIEATFSEDGSIRKTNGRWVWKIQSAGNGLKGTFVSTAAKTSGTSAATKQL
jgi:hypothetical protein